MMAIFHQVAKFHKLSSSRLFTNAVTLYWQTADDN